MEWLLIASGDITLSVWLLATTLLVGIIISVNAIYHYKRNTPTNFWTGSVISSEEITDIPAYNRANVQMWAVYLICLALTSAIAFLNWIIGLSLFIVVLIIGVILMIKVYKRIYKKYKSATGHYRVEI